MKRKYILYSDFNCPFCYLMHELLKQHELEQHIEWRGVQHATYLPIPMQTDNPAMQIELSSEIAQVKSRAPNIAISTPEGKPNTGKAIEYVMKTCSEDQSQLMASIHSIYELYWVENKDISEQELLESSLNLADTKTKSWVQQKQTQWQNEWQSLNVPVVPYLLSSSGRQVAGLPDDKIILEFINEQH